MEPFVNNIYPVRLRCEYFEDPLGIDAAAPRLSWQCASEVRGAVQSAYQVLVASNEEALENGPWLWDSGKVADGDSIHHAYAGPKLVSRQRCYWRVRIWDGDGNPSPWSESAWWEMGLLRPRDWRARWITPAGEADPAVAAPAPMLRSEFKVDGEVASARLYVTSLGLYQAALNARPVADWLLTPGWTSYQKRIQYQTYDVAGLLTQGANALGVTLGDGWYRGTLGFRPRRGFWGDQLALLLQLHIVYADGREQIIGSDEDWRASTGPIQMAELYHGETYDARLEKPGWDAPGYKAAGWKKVRTLPHTLETLVAQNGPPVRRIDTLKPVAILTSPAGETIFDFGQNMVGWVRLEVQGEAGQEVVLRHGEVLDADGNLYTANLRSAKQMIRYTLKGGGTELYEPSFTFQGFRYVAVDSFPGTPGVDNLTGIVIHSDMAPTGEFACSHPLLNQLQHNIVWGQKGNFVDVPTDCPQRDERLGWTGDAQVFCRTAAFNMDVAAFFTKWLADLRADQKDDGRVAHVVPDILQSLQAMDAGSAAWADAVTIIPWMMYQCYGDTRILEEQFDAMVAWVEYMRKAGKDELIHNTGFHYGDWLALDQKDGDGKIGATDTDLIATAFYAWSATLLSKAAEVLSRRSAAQKYSKLAERVRSAFRREFVTPGGRLASNTQTAYILALMFDLLKEDQRPEAAQRLVADIRRKDTHLTAGFVGSSYLCAVLARFGYLDVAYDLLLQESYPSWLFPVKVGATTIWERWDGQRPDGSFQDPEMNSFNHYAYGAIGDWMYRVVAGLANDPAHPGYRQAIVQPKLGGGLTWASAALESMVGRYAVSWSREGDKMELNVTVPANGAAEVHLPGAQFASVSESGRPLHDAAGVRAASQQAGAAVVEVGAGTYRFSYKMV